jgi:hypothetical protein
MINNKFNIIATLHKLSAWDKKKIAIAGKAPQQKLRLITTKSVSPFRKSSNGIKKQSQIVAKGHNVTYEIVNPLKHTSAATDDVGEHVSENGGTWQFTFFAFAITKKASRCNPLKLIDISWNTPKWTPLRLNGNVHVAIRWMPSRD